MYTIRFWKFLRPTRNGMMDNQDVQHIKNSFFKFILSLKINKLFWFLLKVNRILDKNFVTIRDCFFLNFS